MVRMMPRAILKNIDILLLIDYLFCSINCKAILTDLVLMSCSLYHYYKAILWDTLQCAYKIFNTTVTLYVTVVMTNWCFIGVLFYERLWLLYRYIMLCVPSLHLNLFRVSLSHVICATITVVFRIPLWSAPRQRIAVSLLGRFIFFRVFIFHYSNFRS